MKTTKNFLGLGLLVTINLALQFLFQWYIIVHFGAGRETDAFFGALAIPQFILLVLSGSLTLVLIPMFSNIKADNFQQEIWSVFWGVILLFSLLAIVLFISAGLWVKLILPGTDGALTLYMIRVQLISMVFSAGLSILWAVHSSKGNFKFIEWTSIIANSIAFLLLLLLANNYGIKMAVWMSVLRVFLQFIFLLKVMGKMERPNFNTISFLSFRKKMQPLIAGNVYFKADIIVDKYLSSNASSGELTLLSLAQQLYGMGVGILSKVFINTLIPDLSKAFKENNSSNFNVLYLKRFKLLLVLSVVFFLFLLVAGEPMINLFFSFKNFKADNAHQLWIILLLLFGLWFGGLLGALTSTTFFAKGDTKTPTVLTSILFTIYLPIKVFVFKYYGISGLALSISIYMMFSLLFQMYFLRKKSISRLL